MNPICPSNVCPPAPFPPAYNVAEVLDPVPVSPLLVPKVEMPVSSTRSKALAPEAEQSVFGSCLRNAQNCHVSSVTQLLPHCATFNVPKFSPHCISFVVEDRNWQNIEPPVPEKLKNSPLAPSPSVSAFAQK